MLLLLLLIPHWTLVIAALQPCIGTSATLQEDVMRLVLKCRSPNMEVFRCQWIPLESEENITYTLTYSIGDSDALDCPDYVSGGPNSCFFDIKHTQIWEYYCINITAHTRAGPITSTQFLDVVKIVETDPPFNLSYSMLNGNAGDQGHSVLVSWMYPIVPQVEAGWITLEYELSYRHLSQPDICKVKERLRESSLELFDLPNGSYELMVRCRSIKSNLWSRWSNPIRFTITANRLPVHMLVFMLVTIVAAMIFLIVVFGLIPHGKRIKTYLLSPIPKPRIRGLDPMLIKKGKMDEINFHFSSFHGYKPPQYCMETWYLVNVDASPVVMPSNFLSYYKGDDRANPQHQPNPDRLKFPQSPASYCRAPPEHWDTAGGAKPPQNRETGHAYPELVSFPGMDYSVILNPVPAETTAMPPTSPDFYTCISEVSPTGVVHLVPCLPNAVKTTSCPQLKMGQADDSAKSSQLLLEKQMWPDSGGAGETDQRESTKVLLHHAADRK